MQYFTEGGFFMHRNKPKQKADDEVVIKLVDAWQFSVSRSRKRLYVDTINYHPFKLALTRNELQELMDTMDNMVNGGIEGKEAWR
jgi:hypothetical protein